MKIKGAPFEFADVPRPFKLDRVRPVIEPLLKITEITGERAASGIICCGQLIRPLTRPDTQNFV